MQVLSKFIKKQLRKNMLTKNIIVYFFIKRVYNYSIELVKPLQACSNTQDVYFLKSQSGLCMPKLTGLNIIH